MWIPPEIWGLGELTITERVLLSEIASLSSSPSGCFAGNEYFGELLGLSKESIKKYLAKLSRSGCIEIQVENNQRKIAYKGGKILPSKGKILPTPRVKSYPKEGKILPPTIYRDISRVDIKEEAQNSPPEIVLPFLSNEFKNMWEIWKEERKAQKVKAYTPRGEQAALHNLQKISSNDEKRAIEIIGQSIAQGWRGLFPLKGNSRGYDPGNISGDELAAYIKS